MDEAQVIERLALISDDEPAEIAQPGEKPFGRLFRRREHLTPLMFNLAHAEDCEFGRFVSSIEEAIEVRLPASDSAVRLYTLQRPHHITKGLASNIMNIFRDAAYILDQEHHAQLHLDLLIRAVERGMGDTFTREQNLFVENVRNRLDRPLSSKK